MDCEWSDYGSGQWVVHNRGGRHLLVGRETLRVVQVLATATDLDDAWHRYRQQVHGFLTQQAFIALAYRCIESANAPAVAGRYLTNKKTILSAKSAAQASSFLAWLFSRNIFAIVMIPTLVGACVALWVLWSVAVVAPIDDATTLSVAVFAVGLSGIIHELGHAAAAQARGIFPGAIGVGMYLRILPVFYTDLSDAWRLARTDRCVVNLGGILAQTLFAFCILSLALAGTPWSNALQTAGATVLAIAMLQFSPFLRSDGYWLIADMLNEPRLGQARITDVLARLSRASASLERRRATWILAFIVANAVMYGLMLFWLARSCRRITGWVLEFVEHGIVAPDLFSLRTIVTLLVIGLLTKRTVNFCCRGLAQASAK